MSKNSYLTATKLYDYLQCPHRVWRDIYGPEDEKIKETNPFVQLLWDKGVYHEQNVISQLGTFEDLTVGDIQERISKTDDALNSGVDLLYQPVIAHKNLLGIPDLLRKQPDGSYAALDIKSGRGYEGVDESADRDSPKLKKHYAVQLALYTEILEKLGFSNGKREGYIYDIELQEVLYQLKSPMGVKTQQTFWEFYEELKVDVMNIMQDLHKNDPAMAGICKLCPWYNSCKKWVAIRDDTSGLFYVGRSVRDQLKEELHLSTVKEAQNLNVEDLLDKKKHDKNFLKGIGKKTLDKIKIRAEILSNKKPPVLYEKLDLPQVENELYFDIEDDPTQAFVYLHGVYERTPQGEKFIPFVADAVNPESEAKAWQEFWDYVKSFDENNFAIYYYSHHERTTYKKMSSLYPKVASEDDIEWLFDKSRAVDLYTDVILKNTDWPVGSYSLKTIAQYLGFKWRDETPSGALSIQWYNEYLKTGDKSILERILIYNEDDCKATLVIKDALMRMKVNR